MVHDKNLIVVGEGKRCCRKGWKGTFGNDEIFKKHTSQEGNKQTNKNLTNRCVKVVWCKLQEGCISTF